MNPKELMELLLEESAKKNEIQKLIDEEKALYDDYGEVIIGSRSHSPLLDQDETEKGE